MAPGSVISISSSSSRDTSPSGSCELPGANKPGLSSSRIRVGQRNPPMLRMVLEALQAREKRQGTSVVAIKVYIQQKYPTVDATRFKYLLKQALDTGMRRGLFTRPANSKARGATGSFKLVPKQKKKRTCTPTARRGATDAKGTGPKKPAELKKDHVGKAKMEKVVLKPGQKRKACPCSSAVLEMAPKKASRATLKPGKATGAPPIANMGQKVNGRGSKQEAEACGKTKDVCEKSKPSSSKVKNSVASLTKRKPVAMAHPEAVAEGAKTAHKTKAPTPSQDLGHKSQPVHRARKTKTPENPKKPGLSPKTSSKAPSKKAEASS
ncbi:histone H1.8 [Acomys russatus]|uniref:histone H1.8 n=1 Tax=Acomys russatus TaxID=60746 RepID=UPI0021E2CF91|nr:histone H1.8 [Acomys russatus]